MLLRRCPRKLPGLPAPRGPPAARPLATQPPGPGQPAPVSFWPPGPPASSKDPAVAAQADRLYAGLLARFQKLDRHTSPAQLEALDPWSRREAWRYHPYFGGINVLKHAFPGLSWALAAFAGYCVYEQVAQ